MSARASRPTDLMVCVALASFQGGWACSDEVRAVLSSTYGWNVSGPWVAAALRRLRFLDASPVDASHDRLGYPIWSYRLNWRGDLWMRNRGSITAERLPAVPS